MEMLGIEARILYGKVVLLMGFSATKDAGQLTWKTNGDLRGLFSNGSTCCPLGRPRFQSLLSPLTKVLRWQLK